VDTGSGGARLTPTDAGVAWMEVRDAAVSAVRRGWPVVPGICRPDNLGFSQVCPLEDTWDSAPITDPEHAEEIWTARRHVGVLLVCGRGIDALEVPFRVTEVLPALGERDVRVPIATALAASRWLLFVATDSGTLWPELAAVSVRWRGIGQWVALPPTPGAARLVQRTVLSGAILAVTGRPARRPREREHTPVAIPETPTRGAASPRSPTGPSVEHAAPDASAPDGQPAPYHHPRCSLASSRTRW
jgi:hypothetical protein